MILWTVQTPEAVAVLHRTGLLVADADEPEAHFRPAYRWMARKMRQQIGKPPVSSARPLWAWHRWQGRRARPDLRSSGHLPQGGRGARIEFAAEPSTVLLSDFSLWHHVLNYWYLPASLKDEKAFETTLKEAGLDFFKTKPLPDPAFHRLIEASWERIFDLDLVVRRITDPRAERSVQAAFWVLPLEAVREITWFIAR